MWLLLGSGIFLPSPLVMKDSFLLSACWFIGRRHSTKVGSDPTSRLSPNQFVTGREGHRGRREWQSSSERTSWRMRPAPRPTARCAPSFSVSGITEPSLGTKTKLDFWGSKLRPSPKQQSSEFSSLASTFSHHFHCGFVSAVGLGSSRSNILPFTSVFPGPFLAFPPGLGYFSCFCSLSWTLLPILTLSRIKTYLAAASFCFVLLDYTALVHSHQA